MDLSTRDIGEYTGYTLLFSYATLKEVSDYFLFDFPIATVNEYIYTLVLLCTLAIFIKRVYGWFFKSNKTQSNDDD